MEETESDPSVRYIRYCKDVADEAERILPGVGKLANGMNAVSPLRPILQMVPAPFTVFIEEGYVDSSYRDTYYRYYSSKYSDISRFCQRISIFRGKYEKADLVGVLDEESADRLQDDFVGIVVIRPTRFSPVGKILLDPAKLKIRQTTFVRTTDFSVEIMGNMLTVNSYPMLKQDVEFMTCAEVSLWTIFQYYGVRYPEYRTVLPSEMSDVIDRSRTERILPSMGMGLSEKSSVLKAFGFQPLIIESDADAFREMFHYYVESGIPVLLSKDKHSLVCIGHGPPKWDMKPSRRIEGVPILDSYCFYNEYVIMDDARLPFTLLPYDLDPKSKDDGAGAARKRRSSKKNAINPTAMVIPLYRRINMDAQSARFLCDELLRFILKRTGHIDITQFTRDDPLVCRLQLTTSRKYQHIRSKVEGSESLIYIDTKFPKFVWLYEFSTKSLYKEGEILGEMVLDATASRTEGMDSLILFRYTNLRACRSSTSDTFEMTIGSLMGEYGLSRTYPLYKNNLREIAQ